MESKPSHGIHIELELSRKEYDLLLLACRKDKREIPAQIKWLVESYGMGFLPYTEEGSESRKLLRAGEAEIHYPDSISVSTSRAADKE